jgi:mannitol-1-phosphate 5-dehydrogenase
MALTGEHTYVGFGFGAIQAGLFLYEAFESGHFRRLVVAEVVPAVVAQVRAAGGVFAVNIAHADRIEAARVGPVEIYNPGEPGDRAALVAALAEAQEIGTAIPSVNFYASAGPGSLHRVLAEGLARKAPDRPAVIYAAENNNTAAEILARHVAAEITLPRQVQFLNTVVGKMSGLADDPAAKGLAVVTPDADRAFLVEAFNHILISKVHLDGFRRGIEVFAEKGDLLPFEEAKLYGHNATHALAAYLAGGLGLETIGELRGVPGFVPFLRDAFLEESGEALIRKHRGVDPLFTPDGYRAFADDLLERMTNPFLMDTVARVGRDPERKLGWDDRLIGTMRVAMAQGVEPRRYAIGAAAAIEALGHTPDWPEADADERRAVRERLAVAQRFLDDWREADCPNLHACFGEHGGA